MGYYCDRCNKQTDNWNNIHTKKVNGMQHEYCAKCIQAYEKDVEKRFKVLVNNWEKNT